MQDDESTVDIHENQDVVNDIQHPKDKIGQPMVAKQSI